MPAVRLATASEHGGQTATKHTQQAHKPKLLQHKMEDAIEIKIARVLLERHATLATAESCTGGYIAHRLTGVAGSSAYYVGGVVAYANETKTALLDVPAEVIAAHGAVSREVVELMARGACARLGSLYAVATSGIAGPGGGSKDKPVGTVWMAAADAQGRVESRLRHIPHSTRTDIIKEAGHQALLLLHQFILS